MALGGVKVGIAGDHITLLYQHGEEYIFSSPSLVRGEEMLKTGDIPDCLFKGVVG